MPEDPFRWPDRHPELGDPLTKQQAAKLLRVQPNSIENLIRRTEMSVPFPSIGGRAMPPESRRVVRYWWEKHIRDYATAREIPLPEAE